MGCLRRCLRRHYGVIALLHHQVITRSVDRLRPADSCIAQLRGVRRMIASLNYYILLRSYTLGAGRDPPESEDRNDQRGNESPSFANTFRGYKRLHSARPYELLRACARARAVLFRQITERDDTSSNRRDGPPLSFREEVALNAVLSPQNSIFAASVTLPSWRQ